MGKKQDTLAAIFEYCKKKDDFRFHNDLTKEICEKTGFANPFDVTHIDNSDKFPENMYIATLTLLVGFITVEILYLLIMVPLVDLKILN